MLRFVLLSLFVLAALAVPAGALAGEATITAIDVPLAGERALASRATPRFTLVGLHWQGPGTVSFRTRSLGGRWSSWRRAQPEAEDAPDRASAEIRRTRAWRLGNPWWVGASDRIEYRLHGSVRRLRAWLVRSAGSSSAPRTPATAASPQIMPRAGWDADESIVRAKPAYADAIRLSVVHHTAGANGYTQAEAAAIVKGIQLYHVKGNGWNDIGYNFLVDRFGTVYEGRGGGIDRNVVGAHAQGFNTGSVGVALLGTYGDTAPSPAAEEALARLLAWRLDAAHVDPLTTLQYPSNGNPRFPRGVPVFLREISGHRDTGFTSCPGDTLYARLNVLAEEVAKIGLPKLYEPSVTGRVGGLVRFRARLSDALPWTVTVNDALGIQAASFTGAGSQLDWTWDATLLSPGRYTWRIDAGPGARPASGTLGSAVVSPTLAVSEVALDPETVSPNGDGQADMTALSYTLSAPATVSVQALDIVGLPILDLLPPTPQEAGLQTVEVDASALADGQYALRVLARDALGVEASQTLPLLVTRMLGAVSLAPAAFSPNADGRADRLTVGFTLGGTAEVKVRVLREGRWIATPFAGSMLAGRRVVRWDGAKRLGRLRDGEYVAVVEATDELGTSRAELPFASDTRPPSIRFLPGLPVRLRVSEPAALALLVRGVPRKLVVDAPGDVVVASRGRVRAVAWDPAGNRSAVARRP